MMAFMDRRAQEQEEVEVCVNEGILGNFRRFPAMLERHLQRVMSLRGSCLESKLAKPHMDMHT
jgi:hypothetical protein